MILRGAFLAIIIFFSHGICFPMTPADLFKEGKYDEAVEAYREVIAGSKDDIAKASLHKELGDLFVSRGDFRSAAREFIKALRLFQDFSEADRLQMAIYMSWGEKLNEALVELNSIVSKTPENFRARLHLARVLSWTGQLRDSIGEIDKVLVTQPDDRDALLVKANALRWQGHFDRAMIIYQRILEKEEDFDSRLGLVYAYLSAGNMKAAKESRKFLKPQYPYQEKDLKQLDEHMDREIKLNIGGGYSYYNDTDENRVYRYFLPFGFWFNNWKFDLNYRHTDAKDNARDKSAEELSFRTYSKVTEFIGIGAGLGFVQFNNKAAGDFLTWTIKADVKILNGVAGFAFAGEGLTDTAQLMENEIRLANYSLYISQRLTDRWSILGTYGYRDYSDHNNADDFSFSPSYTVYTKNPTINLGYRFRYLNFNRQSGSGYFDPNDFISHQIFASLYFEKEKYYISLGPYGGYQSYRRDGEYNDGFFGGGYGVLGLNLSKNIVFELNGEGGNYALGAAAGFNYYLVGFKFQIYF